MEFATSHKNKSTCTNCDKRKNDLCLLCKSQIQIQTGLLTHSTPNGYKSEGFGSTLQRPTIKDGKYIRLPGDKEDGKIRETDKTLSTLSTDQSEVQMLLKVQVPFPSIRVGRYIYMK